MKKTTEALIRKFYRAEEHPYRIFESTILRLIQSGSLVLDAGCGRRSEAGALLARNSARVIGLDLVDRSDENIMYAKSNLEQLPLPHESMDQVIARSVMEHLEDPSSVWKEIARVLKPRGSVYFPDTQFLG